MPAALLSQDERTVIDALDEASDCALPAGLDPAIHSLEERGWLSLMARGAAIGGEREYALSLTPEGRLVRDELVLAAATMDGTTSRSMSRAGRIRSPSGAPR